MRAITVRETIPGLDVATAYERIADFASYPEHAAAVLAVEVIETGSRTVESSWTVKFRRGLLQWTERDHLDRAAGTISFEQTTGDFASFHGTWRVTPAETGTEVEFSAEFDLGMPSLQELLEPVAENALRDNITTIIAGLLGPSAGDKAAAAASSAGRGH